jgi:hypothetical protein
MHHFFRDEGREITYSACWYNIKNWKNYKAEKLLVKYYRKIGIMKGRAISNGCSYSHHPAITLKENTSNLATNYTNYHEF